jgi:hypothetical protein
VTAADKEGRTSMLAKLTAEVMADKKAAAGTLTPVEGEVAPPRLPNDVGVLFSNEALREHQQKLRQFAADALAIADGLDPMLGGPVGDAADVVDLDAARKQKEKEADEKAAEPDFNAAFRAQQEEAQAKVFKPGVAGLAEELDDARGDTVASDALGWECPTHGKAVTKTSARTGREFIGCPDCNLFKR